MPSLDKPRKLFGAHPCVIVDNDGHIKVEPKIAGMIVALAFVAGLGAAIFMEQWLPFQLKSDAISMREMLSNDVAQVKLELASNEQHIHELEVARATQSEQLGKIEAQNDEILRRIDAGRGRERN